MKEVKQYLICGTVMQKDGSMKLKYYRPHALDWVDRQAEDTYLEYNEMQGAFALMLEMDERLIDADIAKIQPRARTVLIDNKGDIKVEGKFNSLDIVAYQGKHYHK